MILVSSAPPWPEERLREFCKTLPRVVGTSQEAGLRRDYALVLDGLLKTAYSPVVGIGHRGVAINALCSLIGYADALWIAEPLDAAKWFMCLNILLDRSESTKSKPLRQLLLCLTNALSTFVKIDRSRIIDGAVLLVLDILLQQSDHVRAKPALQIFNHLLAKDILKPQTLCELTRNSKLVDVSTDETAILRWALDVLMGWMASQDTSIAASQTIRTLSKKISGAEVTSPKPIQPLWVEPLLKALRDRVGDLNSFRSHLLPELFQSNVDEYVDFLSLLGLHVLFSDKASSGGSKEVDTILLCICLEVGKENGIVVESAEAGYKICEGRLHISEVVCGGLLEHASDAIRLSGLSLLTSSASVTRPFTAFALRCLRKNISNLFMETDVHMRGEVLVHVQRIVERVKAASGPMRRDAKAVSQGSRNGTNAPQSNSGDTMLRNHRSFIRALLEVAKAQLHPAAAYQRHIAGLRTITILAKSGLDPRLPNQLLSKQAQAKEAAKWAFSEAIFDVCLTRLLQDLLMDPFEDVRGLASSILVLQANVTEVSAQTSYSIFMKRAEHLMLSSGRADHADGVSRGNAILYTTTQLSDGGSGSHADRIAMFESLITRLEQRISLARENLQLAVSSYPMHGIIASLRLIIDNATFYRDIASTVHELYRTCHERMVAALHDVWSCVKAVLCNDAPEGHVPDEMEEDVQITTKDILSYCWRALRECSTLMRAVVTKAPIGASIDAVVSDVEFERLCRLSFAQLLELRHRGAFSAVAQTFTACCSRASALKKNDLLDDLVMNTLNAIEEKGSATTRRSAGLPALVVGILSAVPTGSLFKQTMMALMNQATVQTKAGAVHGDPLPQVHAFNCLRSIFINTTLGQYSEPYIAACLSLSGKCLTNDTWAIRNCGLMLFRALIDRLLGSADSQNWSDDVTEIARPKTSFDAVPGLLDIVLELLRPDETRLTSPERALESVFPALKLIQRMPPPAKNRDNVSELVIRLCASPHWHVRDMAARTYATLIGPHERLGMAKLLVPRLGMAQNLIHGHLLCIIWLVKMQSRVPQDINQSLTELQTALSSVSAELDITNPCPFTRAAYLDALNVIDLERLRSGLAITSTSVASTWDFTQVIQEAQSVRPSRGTHLLLRNYLPILVQQESQSPVPTKHLSDTELAGYLLWLQQSDAPSTLKMIEVVIEHVNVVPGQVLKIIARHLSLFAARGDRENFNQLSTIRGLLVQIIDAMPDCGYALSPSLTGQDMKQTFYESHIPSPGLVENTVRLWGILAKQAYFANGFIDVALCATLREMMAILRPFINEHQSFDLRLAAARCLQSLGSIWTAQFSTGRAKQHADRTKLALILLVYDLLNDDDEEIREIAVDVAAIVIAAQASSDGAPTGSGSRLVPQLASKRLLLHMTKHYAHVPLFHEQVFSRMLDLEKMTSAASAFSAAGSDQTALFAVEKQNLFVDPVREAMLWSRAMKNIPVNFIRHSTESMKTLRAASKYIREAINLIRAKLDDESGENDVLGWTSKPDMFIFGMRLWVAIDAVLSWRRRNGRRSDALFTEMIDILGKAVERTVHPHWISQIERIFAREIRGRLAGSDASRRLRGLAALLDQSN